MATFGYAVLPDVGELSYNGVEFTSLFHTTCTAEEVPDAAARTTKCVRVRISASGYVTLPTPNSQLTSPRETTDTIMAEILRLLSAQGGRLAYKGKGLGQVLVNQQGGGGLRDIAFGPKPKVLEFKPLGASRAAEVTWQVEAEVPQTKIVPGQPQFVLRNFVGIEGQQNQAAFKDFRGAVGAVVQFNEEVQISYDEDNYVTMTVRGTLEVPITRLSVNDRTVRNTVDDYRQRFLDLRWDLTRYRVVRRNFNVSRDRRTCEWEFVVEELPPMGLPPGASSARGMFSCRPYKKSGAGFVGISWLCTLKGSYTIGPGYPSRMAWAAFVTLLKFRMEQSARGNIPAWNKQQNQQEQNQPRRPAQVAQDFGFGLLLAPFNPLGPLGLLIKEAQGQFNPQEKKKPPELTLKPFLKSFQFDEGLYLDSKETVTFEATWFLITSITHLLLATGLNRYSGWEGGQRWAKSVQEVQGWRGNYAARLGTDFIIDLGDAS